MEEIKDIRQDQSQIDNDREEFLDTNMAQGSSSEELKGKSGGGKPMTVDEFSERMLDEILKEMGDNRVSPHMAQKVESAKNMIDELLHEISDHMSSMLGSFMAIRQKIDILKSYQQSGDGDAFQTSMIDDFERHIFVLQELGALIASEKVLLNKVTGMSNKIVLVEPQHNEIFPLDEFCSSKAKYMHKNIKGVRKTIAIMISRYEVEMKRFQMAFHRFMHLAQSESDAPVPGHQ